MADLGVSPIEIGKRLNVRRSTVTRWMAAGKLNDTRRKGSRKGPYKPYPHPGKVRSPAEWARTVREAYDLDATDDQLVDLAESSLSVARDENQDARVRLAAAGRFQAIVKQLALVARAAEAAPEPVAAAAVTPSPIRRVGPDPRTRLQAVK